MLTEDDIVLLGFPMVITVLGESDSMDSSITLASIRLRQQTTSKNRAPPPPTHKNISSRLQANDLFWSDICGDLVKIRQGELQSEGDQVVHFE